MDTSTESSNCSAAQPWPVNHPLPIAEWGAPRPALQLTIQQHEDLITKAQAIISQIVASENYDITNNFILLYEAYKAARNVTFREFFPKYHSPIIPKKLTCVGLAMKIEKRLKVLEEDFPGFSESIMIVSCDECIQDFLDYATSFPRPQEFRVRTEKNHVVVAININIGTRNGVLLSDLGYHNARLVTVMRDGGFPQIGWMTQSDEPHSRKEYMYRFHAPNPNYVEWHVRDTRGSNVNERMSFFYVERPFLTGPTYTEKLNLTRNRRNIVARDPKGQVIAGINYTVTDQQFSLFFIHKNVKQWRKLNFENFLESQKIPKDLLDDIAQCNKQLNLEDGELLTILRKLATIFGDKKYMKELLDVRQTVVDLIYGK